MKSTLDHCDFFCDEVPILVPFFITANKPAIATALVAYVTVGPTVQYAAQAIVRNVKKANSYRRRTLAYQGVGPKLSLADLRNGTFPKRDLWLAPDRSHRRVAWKRWR